MVQPAMLRRDSIATRARANFFIKVLSLDSGRHLIGHSFDALVQKSHTATLIGGSIGSGPAYCSPSG